MAATAETLSAARNLVIAKILAVVFGKAVANRVLKIVVETRCFQQTVLGPLFLCFPPNYSTFLVVLCTYLAQ